MKTLKILNMKITILILLSIVSQSFFCFVIAQQNRQIGVNPVMKVSNLNKITESPMRLDILKIDIKVIGQIAITTLDMTYYNSNPRVMEGEFNFPLGEGQSVSRFALDIKGELREGVVVEKEQGRKTFEAIVRKGIDPGLLEMTEGNNFRMRVYPLPAKGTRRIVMAIEQELTDKGNKDLYLLPLKIEEAVGKFSVHIEVIKNQVDLDTENNELSNLSFKHWNDSFVTNFEQDNYLPNKQIALTFPHLSDSAKIFSASKNSNSDSSYFYLSVRPRFLTQEKQLPKKITLLLDNSNSSQNRDIEKELDILDGYIRKIGNLVIEMVPFNIKTGKTETFTISNGNWDKLKSAIKTMTFDGGTSLGCIDFTKFKSDEVLLFTDGMTSFGNSEPKFSNTPVNTINSSVTANHPFLTYIAQRSGGVYVNLNKLTNNEALFLLDNNNFHFISAQIENGKVSNIYPSMPCQFNNSFSMTGIMAGKSATLLLNFGFGNTVMYSKRIMIYADNTGETVLVSRLWAEKKIEELNLNAEKNKDEILLTGKEFSIVTPNTSFLILENLSDYLQYNIVPPKDMQDEYFRQMNSNEKDASKKILDHIDSVVELSDRQSKWWNTKFPILQQKTTDKINMYTPPAVVDSIGVLEEVRDEELATSDAVFMVVEENVGAFNENSSYGNQLKKEQKSKSKADIQLNAWDPQTPYLKVLQYSPRGEEYRTYLKLKVEYGSTPSFYIDASDFFSNLGAKDTAVTILSNLAELKIESPQLLRVLGKKLLDLKYSDESVLVFEKVLKLRSEEPQSFLDLGLAYEANGNSQKSIKTLYEVVKGEWNSRFPAIEIIVLNEINNIISLHPKLDYSFIDKRLIKKEPVDIRVVLSWDTDNSDMDLWVTDPTDEKCYYEHKLTRSGGKISNDFTNGYGPEEYMIKNAIKGKYLVQVNYFGTHSQSLLAPVNLHLIFITNFGKLNQKKQEVTIRLENQKDIIDVGKFSFETN
jgi:hypothetical protein